MSNYDLDALAASVGAVYANRVLVSAADGSGVRLTFVEQVASSSAGEVMEVRSAVYVPNGTLLGLHKTINDMIEAAAKQQAPAKAPVKKPSTRAKRTRH